MKQNKTIDNGRRAFIVKSLSVGAGLTLGVYLSGCSREDKTKPTASTTVMNKEATSAADFEPNAFVRIHPDNTITVIIKHLEMGQGTYTGLATVVAEELDAAWSQIKPEGAPANAKLYNNLLWGPTQGTGGSTAMANSFTQMRKAGAAARQMLIAAAAIKWSVPENEISVQDGVVHHAGSGKQATFGELTQLAAQQPVPQEVFLKDPKEFRLIGKDVPRKDSHAKINGTAIYTQDIKLPGLLTAVVAHPPRFGAKVKSFDASKAKAIKGVTDVVQVPNGVAVLATDFWSAKKGRDALQIEWDESNAFKLSSSELLAQYKSLANKAGSVARNDGDANKSLQSAAQTLHAEYEFPYLAHAAMEPLNCVVQLSKDGCEIWNGEQSQTSDQHAVAHFLNIQPEQVKLNMLYAGGSFGRRANPNSDYVLEAVAIAKAIDGKAPVKMLWTREDDMRAGYYRPMYYHRVQAGLDKDGKLVAWHHRIVGQSILANTAFSAMIKNGIDMTSVEGAANLPYAIPNLYVDLHTTNVPVPVQWWRSVGSTHTAYAVETFIDQIATTAKQDPVAFRRGLLKDKPRHLGVLELAAEKAGWGQPLAAGRGRGVAVHESFNTFVAQVADVTVHADKSFSVDRVVIAVDCGIAVNPDIIHAQMEGGMGFGLSPALSSQMSLHAGEIEQSNFHDYIVLRMDQMPVVEVYIVPSDQQPTGVGEPATPVIAPAIANALAQATGQRLYTLPLKLSA
jgi:isoquinoline 1-oxidoreductase beta subunit